MIRVLALLLLALSVTGCESQTIWGQCIGLDRAHERPDREYRLSDWNAVWSVIFIEMIVPPVIWALDDAFCPVGPKAVQTGGAQ